jgi:hypothetical protein
MELLINILLNLGTLVCATYVGFVSSHGGLRDLRRNGFKKITRRGKKVLSYSLIAIFLTLASVVHTDYRGNQKDIQAKIIQLQRDSILKADFNKSLLIMKSKYDTSNYKVVGVISEVLGKYGYELDTSNKSLRKLVTEKNPIAHPIIFTSKNEFYRTTGIKDVFKLTLNCITASATNMNIKIYAIPVDSFNNWLSFFDRTFLSANEVFPANSEIAAYYEFSSEFVPFLHYIYTVGTYTGTEDNKIINIDELSVYNVPEKRFFSISGKSKTDIRSRIRKMAGL